MNFTLMFAIGMQLEIGCLLNKNGLPWNLPGDLKRFRNRTINGTVIMGRKTFESLPGPLQQRRNIVLTKEDKTWPGVETFHSLEEALESSENPFVIGGKQVICQAIKLNPKCIDLTLVHDVFPNDGTVYLHGFDLHKMNLYDRAMMLDGENSYSFIHIKNSFDGKELKYKLTHMIDGSYENNVKYDHRIYELQEK